MLPGERKNCAVSRILAMLYEICHKALFPVNMHESEVEKVASYKYLAVHLINHLKRTTSCLQEGQSDLPKEVL